MIITDEMVEKAVEAYDEFLCDPPSMRAALEAIAPMLIARGMQQALGLARRTLIWSADQEAKFVEALRDAGMA